MDGRTPDYADKAIGLVLEQAELFAVSEAD